jgi:hypothetical protein
MSITKAAEVAGVSRATVQSMVAAKRIKCKKVKFPRREGSRGPVSPLRVNPAQVKRALMRRRGATKQYPVPKYHDVLTPEVLATKTLLAMGKMLIAVAGE